jgi:predicted GIY-YIG superfamily endonuclease
MRKRAGIGIRERGSVIFVLTIWAGLSLACKSETAPKASEPFPQSGEVPGWARTGETRTFQADRLWEYIDGDAERYIQAGVVQTLTADYRFQDKTDAVADVHIMKTWEGPKKLLEPAWSAGSQRVPIGEDARLFETTLVFRKGRYLVQLVAYEEGPHLGQALVELGKAIEKRL